MPNEFGAESKRISGSRGGGGLLPSGSKGKGESDGGGGDSDAGVGLDWNREEGESGEPV